MIKKIGLAVASLAVGGAASLKLAEFSDTALKAGSEMTAGCYGLWSITVAFVSIMAAIYLVSKEGQI